MQKQIADGAKLVPLMQSRTFVDRTAYVEIAPLAEKEKRVTSSPSTRREEHVFDRDENRRILLALCIGSALTWIVVGSKVELAWVLVVGFGVGHLTGMYNMFFLLKHGFSLLVFVRMAWIKIKSIFPHKMR